MALNSTWAFLTTIRDYERDHGASRWGELTDEQRQEAAELARIAADIESCGTL